MENDALRFTQNTQTITIISKGVIIQGARLGVGLLGEMLEERGDC